MAEFDVRRVSLAETRRLRHEVLRPHERPEVLHSLVQHAIAHGASRVWCNARTTARALYERAGFVVASDEFEPPQIGPHYRMELAVPDAMRR